MQLQRYVESRDKHGFNIGAKGFFQILAVNLPGIPAVCPYQGDMGAAWLLEPPQLTLISSLTGALRTCSMTKGTLDGNCERHERKTGSIRAACTAPARKAGRALRDDACRLQNPLELWGEPSYNERWISVSWFGLKTIIANDPGLIRHVLVDNAANYPMSAIRQRVLRPLLRDGLLTAEGQVWKRSRKAMAPVFTPRHIGGFAEAMRDRSRLFVERYKTSGMITDVAHDMTLLTYDILAETLFSGDRGRSK